MLASKLLQVPQSTISRRMRAFQADHRLTIRRSGGGLKVLSPLGYLDDLRRLAQRFRLLHSDLSWSAHPVWSEGFHADEDHLGLYFNLATLSQEDIASEKLDPRQWLEQRLLDAYLEASLCDVPTGSSSAIGILLPPDHNPKELGPLQLGAFVGLEGLEEALTARGWKAP